MIRLPSSAQLNVISYALELTLQHRAPDESTTPSWIELHEVTVPDLQAIAIRFPGAAMVDVDETGEKSPVVGIYVVMFDSAGDPMHVHHSAAGPLGFS